MLAPYNLKAAGIIAATVQEQPCKSGYSCVLERWVVLQGRSESSLVVCLSQQAPTTMTQGVTERSTVCRSFTTNLHRWQPHS